MMLNQNIEQWAAYVLQMICRNLGVWQGPLKTEMIRVLRVIDDEEYAEYLLT